MLATSIKWGNSPVTSHSGTIDEIRLHIPSFERRPFGKNLRLDTVVRLPHEDDPGCVPVGVVSKDYVLLPHTEVLDLAVQALEAAKVNPADVRAELRITELGERMALVFALPDLLLDPGDEFPMQVRLECLNSVDGSTRFRAEMGWFRLVCSNGLRFKIAHTEANRRHVGNLQLAHIGDVLGSGLRDYQSEREGIEQWAHTDVSLTTIDEWADSTLRSFWGLKAATRALHIAYTGCDARVLPPFKGRRPTTVETSMGGAVPGSPACAETLFDVSQMLAWLAKERRDVQEQVEWRSQIPDLMEMLEVSA